MKYPAGPAPELPERFAGLPVVAPEKCRTGCAACVASCPVEAIEASESPETGRSLRLDLGKCIFCRACEPACAPQAITFTRDHRLAAARREDLVVAGPRQDRAALRSELAARLFGRSLKLREVSAGGCNACEADTNVLNTVGWDLGRFGIQFVASPRHADGLLITGPVTQNMREALEKTYHAVPAPKVVIAVGACAIGGGPYAGHPEVLDGAAHLLPVDLFVPGCPPHPLTILDALLGFLGVNPQKPPA
jgi:Ni,Fe-hydrogenase III small subunit/ferredoxin